MDDYNIPLHRVAVRDITTAWAIAVTLLALLALLPVLLNHTAMISADPAEIGTSGATAETIQRDADGWDR